MSKSKVTKRIKQILFLLTAIAFSARAASARQVLVVVVDLVRPPEHARRAWLPRAERIASR